MPAAHKPPAWSERSFNERARTLYTAIQSEPGVRDHPALKPLKDIDESMRHTILVATANLPPVETGAPFRTPRDLEQVAGHFDLVAHRYGSSAASSSPPGRFRSFLETPETLRNHEQFNARVARHLRLVAKHFGNELAALPQDLQDRLSQHW